MRYRDKHSDVIRRAWNKCTLRAWNSRGRREMEINRARRRHFAKKYALALAFAQRGNRALFDRARVLLAPFDGGQYAQPVAALYHFFDNNK